MSENNNTDLNEVFEEEMDDSTVITVPIDETLSNSGEAADAAAVGAALAQKADKDELPATIKVNGQQADNQGLILINGTHIPVSGTNQKTLAQAVEEATGMTAETLPMSSDQGAETVAQKISDMAEDITELQQAGERTAENIPMETGSTTTVKNAIETLDRKAVKSVNRKLPDAAGDVDLSVVPLAENLQSDKLQSIEGEFIIRTTGGTGSVSDGKAYPQHIYGNCRHDGYVAEELNMTVIPITRTEPDEPITATIDRDTFVAAVDESSTINLYYTTEWSEDPADYGVTVTGDPVAGDQITIVYVKEQRGTILVADPDRLVGTGWNLFNANEGYARVVKYSDVYGYKIGGTYTSIAFSATLTGDRTSLLPNANGLFNVPSDGYVFVTGGNATDTYILATWSDWTNGPSTGYWEAYRESGIDLSAVVETYFPYGMLKIGTVRDEIDLVAKRSISRIERMVYSEENRAAAAATGRAYDIDESNIYIVRAEYVQNAITISTEYSVSEHGLEWFTETDLPLDTEILYGKNLRDKLERDVLTISAQTLTEEEKEQARTNIGAMSQEDGDKKLVAPTAAGTAGQLLRLKADGGTEWNTQGTPTDAQVGTAVSAWLTAHPEATTTVQDGAISRAKLNDDLKEKTDAVPDLKSALSNVSQQSNPLLKDILNINFSHPDYYPNPTDGGLSYNTNWTSTDYIFVGGLLSFTISGMTTSQKPFVAYYDQNMVFKRHSSTQFNQVVNDGEYYIRIGIIKADESSFEITPTNSDMFGWYSAMMAQNMFKEYPFEFGGYLASSDGSFAKDNSGTYFCTDFIPCQIGFGLYGTFGQVGGGYYNVVGYDENKAFVENIVRFDSNKPWGYYSVNSNTKYIRIVTTAAYKTTGVLISFSGASGIINEQFNKTESVTSAQLLSGYKRFYSSKCESTSGLDLFSSGYSVGITNLIYKGQIIEKVAFTDAIEESKGYYLIYIDLTGKVLAKFSVSGQEILLNYTAPDNGILVFCSTSGVSYGSVQFKYKYNVSGETTDIPVFNYLLHQNTTIFEVGDTVPTAPNFLTIYRNIVAVSVTVYGETAGDKGKFLNKKISFLGDSITAGVTSSGGTHITVDNPYPKLVDILLKCNTQNVGHSGYPISSLGQANCFLTTYTEIADDADYIVVFGGTNDYGLNVPLGTIADTTDISFYGAVRLLINDIKTAHSNKQVVFMTPIHRQNESANTAGATLTDYVNAIKDVCALCAIPVIDLNHISGLSYAVTENQQYFSDGLHPTQAGYNILAQVVANELNGVLVEYID